jgi:hypothetical protein
MKRLIPLLVLLGACESTPEGAGWVGDTAKTLAPNYVEVSVLPSHSYSSGAWDGNTIDEEAVWMFTMGWRLFETPAPDPRPVLEEIRDELQHRAEDKPSEGKPSDASKGEPRGDGEGPPPVVEDERRYTLTELGLMLAAVLAFIGMVAKALHKWTNLFTPKPEA